MYDLKTLVAVKVKLETLKAGIKAKKTGAYLEDIVVQQIFNVIDSVDDIVDAMIEVEVNSK